MTRRGAGSLRQRRPGVWEIRISVGVDPVSGLARQRSVTVHGELAEAEQRRALLAAQADQLRRRRVPPLTTVAELLARWLAAEHDWKPSTWQGYRQAARRLRTDPLTRRRPESVSSPVLRAAMRTWQAGGMPPSTMALYARTLKGVFGVGVRCCGWPRTPAPGAGSWPRCAARTCTALDVEDVADLLDALLEAPADADGLQGEAADRVGAVAARRTAPGGSPRRPARAGRRQQRRGRATPPV